MIEYKEIITQHVVARYVHAKLIRAKQLQLYRYNTD